VVTETPAKVVVMAAAAVVAQALTAALYQDIEAKAVLAPFYPPLRVHLTRPKYLQDLSHPQPVPQFQIVSAKIKSEGTGH